MEAKTKKFKAKPCTQGFLFHYSLFAVLSMLASWVGLFLFIVLLILSVIFLVAIFKGHFQHTITFLASSILSAALFGGIKTRL